MVLTARARFFSTLIFLSVYSFLLFSSCFHRHQKKQKEPSKASVSATIQQEHAVCQLCDYLYNKHASVDNCQVFTVPYLVNGISLSACFLLSKYHFKLVLLSQDRGPPHLSTFTSLF